MTGVNVRGVLDAQVPLASSPDTFTVLAATRELHCDATGYSNAAR